MRPGSPVRGIKIGATERDRGASDQNSVDGTAVDRMYAVARVCACLGATRAEIGLRGGMRALETSN